MEYLHHTIMVVFWFGIIPVTLTTASVAAVRAIYRWPFRTHGGWQICVGAGLLATALINLAIGLLIGAGWLIIGAGWWQLPVEPTSADYTAPVAMAINTAWCTAVLWLLHPNLRPTPIP